MINYPWKNRKMFKLNSIEKLKGFDFEVKTIDGHNYNEIYTGLNFLKKMTKIKF